MAGQTDYASGNQYTVADTQTEAIPPENPVDPLKDILRDLRKSMQQGMPAGNDYGIDDPLKEELDAIRIQQKSRLTEVSGQKERHKTLLFGADKWEMCIRDSSYTNRDAILQLPRHLRPLP